MDTSRKGIAWKISKETYMNYIKEGMLFKEIAKKVGVARSTLRLVFNSYGIEDLHQRSQVIRYERLAKFNFHKFDIIDTEEKAYWLGMMYSDGCVMFDEEKKRYEIYLGLASRDVDHVIKFKNFLEDTRDFEKCVKKTIDEKEDGRVLVYYTYIVKNKHLAQSLVNLGCVPRKSLILKFPNEQIFTDKNLVYHFIRGYVDGDGSIFKRPDNGVSLSLVGTYDFLSGVRRYFSQFPNIYKYGNVYTIRISYKKAEEVIYKLYEGSTIYLDRKYKRFAEWCRYHHETSDKIGESCDANAEVTPEIAKGLESTVENSE